MRRVVPVDGRQGDWPRLVANAVNEQGKALSALEGAYLPSGGALTLKARAITATGAVAVDDYMILADATSAAITVNLPAVAASAGRVLVVKKTDASANAVTLDGNASETIDGATTKALAAQYDVVTVVCDGSAWWAA